jgi:hypothetical protein
MVNEIGRIIAAVVLVVARVLGRAYHGLFFLVRRARRTRSAASAAASRSGRLLDVAILSVAADLLLLAEWWRRSAPFATVAVGIGLGIAVLAGTAAILWLRGRPPLRYFLAATEAVRLGCVAALAFVPELGTAAVAGLVAFGLLDRILWALLATKAQAGSAAAYIGFLVVPVVLVGLVALALDGLVALLLAQVALLIALGLSFALGTPTPRPAKPAGEQPKPAGEQTLPHQREEPEPDETYHLYRPSSLNGQDGV